ncbi:MAG: hypothetical protein WDN00_17360 [Limisphaerales bacterium]
MKARPFLICLFAGLLGRLPNYDHENSSTHPPVKLGDEVLFEKHLDLIRGKHIGLITNPRAWTATSTASLNCSALIPR